MRVLIVEDEINNARLLQHELAKLDVNILVLCILSSVEQTVAYIKRMEKVDLIFMDIKLSDGYSFEIFEQVPVQTPVIFTTAYNQYAMETFKMNSLCYLLKPIQPEQLKEAINKYVNVVQYYTQPVMVNTIAKKERIIVRKGSGKVPILVNTIAFFYSEMKIPFAVDFSGDRYFLDYSLTQLEEIVDPAQFFRVTRQFIINIKAIREFKSIEFSKMEIQLIKNNWIKKPIIVSQFTAPEFKKWIESL